MRVTTLSNYHLADVVKYMVKSETATDLRHKIKFLCPLKSKSYVQNYLSTKIDLLKVKHLKIFVKY